MKPNKRSSLRAAVIGLVVPICTSDALTTLYSEDFGATGGVAVSTVGWMNDIRNADTRIYAVGADASVYSYAVSGWAEAYYTTEFAAIDPLAVEDLTFSVDLSSGYKAEFCQSYFAVQVGGSWYVSTTELAAPANDNVWVTRTLAYDPTASGWNTLTVSGTGVVGTSATVGGVSPVDLSGNITGAGVVVVHAGSDGTHNIDDFKITEGPADSDLDGLPDTWEIENFILAGEDPVTDAAAIIARQSGTDDSDTDTGLAGGVSDPDGFNNIAEYDAGSDPLNRFSIPSDIDADALADLWEDEHFGNNSGTIEVAELTLQDGFGDPDDDKGTNEDEETAATDPNDRASFLDNDSGTPDGQNDWWEIFYFGDTSTSTSGTDDIEPDTFDNDIEYAAFSDPNDAFSVPGDIDGDGVPDLWEDQYYGNNDGIVTEAELTGTNGTANNDGDAFDDAAEANGMPVASNPFDGNSVPGNSDGDSLDDSWELTYFADIYGQNGLQDSDDDLYTNEEEETGITDPTDNLSYVDDVDMDGINDRWELKYFFTLNGGAGGTDDFLEDSDLDGWFNDEEYDVLGSNPNNIASTPNDIDGDGLADANEIVFWGDIYTYGAGDDPDRDYSTNLEEELGFTDPTNRASSPDADNGGGGDGLGDGWEIFSFGDLTTTENPLDDNDLDGHSNAAEYAAASNGNDPLSTPDTDGDGLPDGWEVFYFILDGEDPIADAAAIIARQGGGDDSDADGASNALELLSGTDPDNIADVPTPALVSTSFGFGADTGLSNDTQNAGTGPAVVNGAKATVDIRNNYASRLHIPMIRFDISQLSGDLDNAALRLSVPWAVSTGGTINVYGLVDGDVGEAWDEATTSYSNAPGIIEEQRNQLNIWARDPQKFILLGTITPQAVGIHLSNPLQLNLRSFLEADTDGFVTLAFNASGSNRWHGFGTKETSEADAPTLVLPNATVTVPAGDLKIASVSLDVGTDVFTMNVAGLVVGEPYHVEFSTNGNFTAVAGSTFTAVSDPEDVAVTADYEADPVLLFRIRSGVEP